MPLFRGSSRFESLILSHHSRKITCACDEEDINDDKDDDATLRFKNDCFAVMRSGSEEDSYSRLVDVCITQL